MTTKDGSPSFYIKSSLKGINSVQMHEKYFVGTAIYDANNEE
jgi:hypothetical protein